MNKEELIQDLQDGEIDKYLKHFDYEQETFFNFLSKKGLLSYLDPFSEGMVDLQNKILLWFYQNDREKYYYWISSILSDTIIEDGQAYYMCWDDEELSYLFCDSRDYSRDTIEKVLTGEFDGYYFDFHSDDLYRDVIEELNKDNLKRLHEYMIDSLKDESIGPHTDELESILQEDGTEKIVINEKNIQRIVSDKESFDYVLDNYLDDLRGELNSIYSNAYESAYHDDLYEEIWHELSTYFEGTGEWIKKKHSYKKDVDVWGRKIKIKDLDKVINDVLYDNYETLENLGNFISVLKEQPCLRVRFPDYPDSRKIDNNINQNFKDYI